MPAHIYMRTGDYGAAAERNKVAAQMDETYINSSGVQGVYPLMYYTHNLHFLAIAYAMQGRFSDAKKAADKLEAHVGPHVKEMPMVEFFMPTSNLILVRFQKWDDILKSPKPNPETAITNAMWHFARGMAYAATGRFNNAETERKQFISVNKTIPAEATWDLNSANSVLKIPENVLDARIALARGNKQTAIKFLRKAAEAEDTLNYAEPPSWYIPVRESLGGVLMLNGDYAEAEKVFRADLEKNPRNGRSLFGLYKSLKAQGKNYDAQLVQREFEVAWKNADIQLKKVENLL
ncbi:MAG TPA: hypothetical protein VH878_03805 [Thermodesulfobacteriota bacterium]